MAFGRKGGVNRDVIVCVDSSVYVSGVSARALGGSGYGGFALPALFKLHRPLFTLASD